MRYVSLLSILIFFSQGLLIAEEWITIFIHGSVGLRPKFAFHTLIKLFRDDINNSFYKRAVDYIRDDNFFYNNQAMQGRGFRKVKAYGIPSSPDTLDSYSGAELFAELYDEVQREFSEEDIHTTYYTFGWSGLVSTKIRYEEARILYMMLARELARLAKKNIFPKIRIIGYSHGGNIGLDLAAIREKEFPRDTFVVDEFILMGTPIQKETDYLVCRPLFKKIYNIYSLYDRIQKLDCFSFHRFFSHRRFYDTKRYRVPATLTQIEIKLCVPPRCYKSCFTHTPRRLVDRSPGHIELWFFGWPQDPHSLYRPHFPLCPLPLAVFIPAIISAVKQTEYNNAIVEWQLSHEKFLIKQRYGLRKKIGVPAPPQQRIAQLQAKACSRKPLSCTKEVQRTRVDYAIKMAKNKRVVCKHWRTKCLCSS